MDPPTANKEDAAQPGPGDELQSQDSSTLSSSWNAHQEVLLKGISERANCMRWLHNQCNLHFEKLNFWFTIPNVIISTLNGSFTMSLNSLFPSEADQRVATTCIGLVSILSAVLITMNQYVKSQQMMEAHRAAALAYGKLHRLVQNELSLRRDQRQSALEFLKLIRTEQDRLENSSPSILPSIILKFNVQFEDRNIEKPEIAGDLDEVVINQATKKHKHRLEQIADEGSPTTPASLKKVFSFAKNTVGAAGAALHLGEGSGIFAPVDRSRAGRTLRLPGAVAPRVPDAIVGTQEDSAPPTPTASAAAKPGPVTE